MPQSVAAYAPARDMAAADRAKRLVRKLYREDIGKYGGLAAKRVRKNWSIAKSRRGPAPVTS